MTLSLPIFLAQSNPAEFTTTTAPPPGVPTTQPARPPSFWGPEFFGLLLAFGVFYYFIIRGQRRERQKQIDMLNSIKRNDRVQTVGGIIGTVVEVRDQEVVLKVDENNNVKIRFVRGAIKEVLRDPTPAAPDKK